MTRGEQDELRALVYAAWPDRHDPERAREHAEAILSWHYLRPLARGDVAAVRRLASEALKAELEHLQEHPPLSIDELVDLLRTDPSAVGHHRERT